MGAVEATGGPKYEKTTDLKRMLTHKLLSEAIRKDWDSIKDLLPARTGTYIRYEKGARTAVAWDEGGREIRIEFPLKDGWYVPDGNSFAIPNGRKSTADDPDALYLFRHQNRCFSGPLGRGDGASKDYRGGRGVYTNGGYLDADDFDWPDDSGVALIGCDAIVSGNKAPIVPRVEQSGATAPLVGVPREELVKVTDPKAMLQRADQLEAAAKELLKRLGESLRADEHARLIKPILDEAAFLRELAGKLDETQSKA